MNKEGAKQEENSIEKMRQILLLTDLVDKYPLVMARRASGIIYLIIAGGISFATLTLMSLQDALGPGDSFLVNLGFIIISLLLSWIIAFRLVVPLTSSYPRERSIEKRGKSAFVVWGTFTIVIIFVSFITLSSDMSSLFPPLLQFIMGSGFLASYIFGRIGAPEFHTHEHAYLAIAILVSIIPVLVLPSIAYVLLLVVDMGGIYVTGLYMLITAERLLLQSKGLG